MSGGPQWADSKAERDGRAFQAAHRLLADLTPRELEALADITARRAEHLRRRAEVAQLERALRAAA